MPFAAGGVVFFLLFALWLWALFDCISTDSSTCRFIPKWLWLVVVLLLPSIGSIAWLVLGRPEQAARRPRSTDYAAPRRPVGIEDHPRYRAIAEEHSRRHRNDT